MIPFHQYQRYKLAELIVNKLKTQDRKYKILEVGANEHRNLEHFLPNDEISYLDIELPEELLSDPAFIKGDATNMHFGDNSFDFVVALDVLEHISPEKRSDFLSETHRVSTQGVILSAPFLNSSNQSAEIRVTSFFKSLYNEDIVWQQEHEQNGLPILDEELAQISRISNFQPIVINHGNTIVWEKLMRMEFLTRLEPGLNEYWEKINTFYNEEVFSNDYSSQAVRSFVIIPKTESFSHLKFGELAKSSFTPGVMERLNDLETSFYHLFFILNATRKEKAQLFVDTGEGFSEEESFIINFHITEIPFIKDFVFDFKGFSDIKNLRFDPMTSACSIRYHSCKATYDNGEVLDIPINGTNAEYKFNNILVFNNDDPQILLNNFDSNLKSITLRIEYISVTEAKTFEIIELVENLQIKAEELQRKTEDLQKKTEDFQLLEAEKNKYKLLYTSMLEKYDFEVKKMNSEISHYRQIESEQKSIISNKENELISLKKRLDQIENSFSWKLTAPLRKINRALRS